MEALVLSQRALGPTLRWMILAASNLAVAQPGQFVMLRCAGPESSDPFLRRALFIADADPKAGTVTLLYSNSEPGARWLDAAVPGQTLDLVGPLGRPVALAHKARQVLLIAEGGAAAPLLFLARRSSSSMLLLHIATARELELPPFLLPPGGRVPLQ
ncbi:MAG: hypothetical protein KatS3mg057_1757 [Herpetosiphonaceae bacterium]|nr:MAG: hypothetical protein KatS3mg057_1757 [Herpetosiphonaceae bacterium]